MLISGLSTINEVGLKRNSSGVGLVKWRALVSSGEDIDILRRSTGRRSLKYHSNNHLRGPATTFTVNIPFKPLQLNWKVYHAVLVSNLLDSDILSNNLKMRPQRPTLITSLKQLAKLQVSTFKY